MEKSERLKDSLTLEENGVDAEGPPQEVHLVHLFSGRSTPYWRPV